MALKNLFIELFIFEILAAIHAGLIFRLIDSKLLAGTIAGGVFCLVGLSAVTIAVKAGRPLRLLTFWTGLLHLIGISLPMLLVRWSEPTADFASLAIFGVPGPLFHRISENFYLLLMISTLIDGLRSLKNPNFPQGLNK